MKLSKFFYMAVAVVMTTMFAACEPSSKEDEGNTLTALKINETEVSVTIGETQQLTLTSTPEDADISSVAWSSNDEDVATVSPDGVVTAVAKGTANITAKVGSVSATVVVTVVLPEGGVESIVINETDIPYLNIGETYQLTLSLSPEDADASRIKWRTDNERVAAISSDGIVTAIGYGRTFVYAEADGESESVSISVNERERNYKLVWEDNFGGPALDESSWNIVGGIPGNDEKQFYLREQPLVENGYLVITAKDMGPLQKDEDGNDIPNSNPNWVEGKRYTSYRINTQGKRFVKYGKIEASISFPSGEGTWCAFWLMPNESVYGGWPRSGEVDIVEHVGSIPNRVSVAAHTNNRNGNVGSQGSAWNQTKTYDNVADNFHTYGIEWIDDYQNGNDVLIFTFDGDVVGRYSQTSWMNSTWQDWPFDQNFYVILNMAIGGKFGGAEPIDDSIFPVQMKVDWVRMYELE